MPGDDELFFRALDATDDPVALVSAADDRFVYVNRAFVRLAGFSGGELVGRTADELNLWAEPQLSFVLGETPSPAGRFRKRSGEVILAQFAIEPVEIRGEAYLMILVRPLSEHRRLEDEIRYLASIVESSKDAVIGKTLDGVILTWNRGAQEMYGFSPEEVVGQHIDILIPPERRDEYRAIMQRIRQGHDVESIETTRLRKNGDRFDVSLRVSAVRAADGSTTGAAVITRDITERKRAEHQLREAETKYRSLVERIPLVTYIDAVDGRSTTIYMSPQIESMVGYRPDEWERNPDLWLELLHPEDRERVIAEHRRTNETGEPFTVEYRLRHRDGHDVWVRDEALLVRDGDGQPQFWQGVMLDITERRRAEEQIEFLAYHDKLTGLPNRTMFEELLGLALARAERHDRAVGVLFMDLDNFKLVNDSLGHLVGDELLAQTAGRLRQVARATDVVARQGGDEFLILLADLDPQSPDDTRDARRVAESVASRINEALKEPFTLAGTEFYMSASVGVSLYPFDSKDASSLLRNADSAMYESKRGGRGGYAIYGGEPRDSLSKLSLTTRLRQAVERQRWVLHYQPLIDLDNGNVFGVEALIRWRDPRRGLIHPEKFIPLAEEMGLTEAIGDWVVEEVCRQAGEWRDEGISILTTFNLSARQLWRRDLVNRITSTIEALRLDPSNIALEITESTATVDPERARTVLGELHHRGVRLAIDDFGTGYSSLSRLKDLPVDILKIDRSFVQDVPRDQGVATMVTAIVQLARNLGMDALAEGIETEDQRRFLVERGCPMGQGFRFSRPLPPAELTSRFRDRLILAPGAPR